MKRVCVRATGKLATVLAWRRQGFEAACEKLRQTVEIENVDGDCFGDPAETCTSTAAGSAADVGLSPVLRRSLVASPAG